MPKRLLIYGFCLSLILSGASSVLADDTLSESESSVLKDQVPQSSYVYDLKNLIKKSRDNIKHVNEKIQEQAVLKRNQKREEKAREYYDIASKLTEEGKLDEAREYYEKAVKITEHPEMIGYIRESERRFKMQSSALEKQELAQQRRLMEEDRAQMERLESHYQAAVSLYKQEKFKESKREFEIVESMYPEYKATRSYLRIVEQDIAAKDSRTVLQQQEEVARQQREAEIARQREKDQWRKEIERKEREREEQIRRQADDVYRQALDLYREKHFTDAKEKFQEVEWVLPDYKSTRKYLRRIDRDIEDYRKEAIVKKETLAERQRWEEEVARKKAEEDQKRMAEQKERERQDRLQEEAEFVYQAGVALISQDRYEEAKAKFREVEQLVPGYKETPMYLERVDEFIDPDGYKERVQAEEAKRVQLSTLYNEGSDALRKQRYGVAQERFEQIMALDPAYHDTETRLAEATNGLAAEARQRESHARAQALKELEAPSRPKKAKAAVAETTHAEKPKKQRKQKKAGKDEPPESSVEIPAAEPAADKDKTQAIAQTSQGMLPLHRYVSEGTVYNAEDSARAKPIYDDAVQHFNQGEFLQARSKFEVLENIYPDFKETRNYMIKIEDALAKRRILDAKSSQEQESQLVGALVMQASALYQQIAALADDKAFAGAFRKFRHVERIIANLQAEQERLAAQIQREEEELRKHQEARLRQLMDMERERREERYHEKAEAVYASALDLYRERRFEEAKVKFMELEDIVSGYKAAQDYLARIDQDIAEEARRQQIEGEREARLAEIAQKKAREEQLRRLDEEDYDRVRQLAEQANGINMEVITLAKERQYEAIAQRFTALQGIFTELQTIKDRMVERWKQWEMTENREAYEAKQAAQEAKAVEKAVHTEVTPEQKLEAMKQKWGKEKDPAQVRAEILRRQQADQLKREEAAKDKLTIEQKRKERDLLKEATALYKSKDFPGARVKFEELAAMAVDPRPAKEWLARVEEAVLTQQQDAEDQTIRDRQTYIDGHKEPVERVAVKTEEERREEAVLQRLDARKKRMEMERQRDIKRAELQRQKERERMIKEQKRELAMQRKRVELEREKYRKELANRSGRYAGYAADYDYRQALGRGAAGSSYGYGQYRKSNVPVVKETAEDRAKQRAEEQLKEKEERLAEAARLAEAKRQAEIIREEEAAKAKSEKPAADAIQAQPDGGTTEPAPEAVTEKESKKAKKAKKVKKAKRTKKDKAAPEVPDAVKDVSEAKSAGEPETEAFAGKSQEELLKDKEFQRMRQQKIKEKEAEQRAKDEERKRQEKLDRERAEKERQEAERLAAEERKAIARQEAEMVEKARTQQIEKERQKREEELQRKKEEELARQKAEEEKRQAEEMERQRVLQEKQKAAEEARQAEEMERQRVLQEKEKAAEEARQAKILQQQKLEEERRLAEQKRQEEKLERERVEAERQQKLQEARLAEEAERKRLAEEKRLADEEARILRQKEEERRLEELRIEQERLAQEAESRRRLEEEKRREEEKLAAQRREREMLAQQQRMVLEQQIQERQDQLQRERDGIRRQLEAGVENIYVEAIELYRQKNYTGAMKRFIEIEELLPGYKKTGYYLDRLQKDILEQNKRYQSTQKQLIPARIPGYVEPSAEDCADESADCQNTFPPKPRQAVISNVLDQFETEK